MVITAVGAVKRLHATLVFVPFEAFYPSSVQKGRVETRGVGLRLQKLVIRLLPSFIISLLFTSLGLLEWWDLDLGGLFASLSDVLFNTSV